MSRLLLIILLLFCLLFGAYWLSHKLDCVNSGAITSNITQQGFYAYDGDFSTSSSEHFYFDKSGSSANISSDINQKMQAIAKHLKNSGNTLNLTGLYSSAEKYNGSSKDLGIARAIDIKNKLVKMGASNNQIKTASAQLNSLSFPNDKLYGGVDFDFSKTIITSHQPTANKPTGLSIVDGSDFNVTTNDSWNFPHSSSKHIPPIASGVQDAHVRLASYLKVNPQKTLTLTGYCDATEKNNTNFDNLGIARAEDIKKVLTNNGIQANRIKTKGQQQNGLRFVNNRLIGGVDYNLTGEGVKVSTTDIAQLAKDLKAKPMNVYFDTGSSYVSMTPELEQYIKNTKFYLSKVSNAKVTVTGHTDNVGNRTSNVKLSKDRADLVRNYLLQRGITQRAISTNGKGPDAPIANNATAAGRKQNRRVEIRIK